MTEAEKYLTENFKPQNNSGDILYSKEELLMFAESYHAHKVASITDEIKEKWFNYGFDEGYTSPMEHDGKSITQEEYETGRKKNYEQLLNYLKK